MVTAENFEMIGTEVVTIVSGLDEEDEQSTDNLGIIARVYEDITNLVESGNVTVTENVRITMRCGSSILMICPLSSFNSLHKAL